MNRIKDTSHLRALFGAQLSSHVSSNLWLPYQRLEYASIELWGTQNYQSCPSGDPSMINHHGKALAVWIPFHDTLSSLQALQSLSLHIGQPQRSSGILVCPYSFSSLQCKITD
jgi:hypothetical protein